MASNPYARIGRPRHADVLTPAEWEVLAGVRERRSNREIAERRGSDLETVRFHLKNVRRKLGIQSRDELRAFPGRPVEAIERARAARPGRRVIEQIPLVHTKNMAAALDFYVGALGFEIVSCWPDEPDDDQLPGWVALGSASARIMLRSGHPRRSLTPPAKPGLVTLNLYVDGLDVFRKDLIDAGYACGEPEALFYGAREFYLLDPDANEIAIVEFARASRAT